MDISPVDTAFAGSVPLVYERYLVPLVFQHYALDMAARAVPRKPGRVLEVAAGTGVLTRRLAEVLEPGAEIVATDLNGQMLEQARAMGTARPVTWREADAQQLPFDDASFDLVACQFGAMFFPEKSKAFAEARRVLRPGGLFLFNVWDRIEHNEFAFAVTQGLKTFLPDDPPRFLARVPYGYHNPSAIVRDLLSAGFDCTPTIELATARSRAEAARVPALAFCQGSPLRGEIEARAPGRLAEATDAATAAVARRFGDDAVDGKMQAHVVAIER
jgi:SAM-dependent methyltransferase